MNIQDYIASGIIETYVMGLCTPEEERELESLRTRFPALQEAIRRYEKELEQHMQQEAKQPPAGTDEKILAALDQLAVPPVQAKTPVVDIRSRRTRLVAAAAVILLLLSAAFNIIQFNKNRSLREGLSNVPGNTLPPADYRVMNDPAITPVAMYGVGIHSICRCTIFWDKKTGKLYIMIHHLPPSSGSRDYQLWAMVDNQPVSIGVIDDSIRGRFIEMKNVPGRAIAFSVTLEKAGGNDQPTMEEEYLRGSI